MRNIDLDGCFELARVVILCGIVLLIFFAYLDGPCSLFASLPIQSVPSRCFAALMRK